MAQKPENSFTQRVSRMCASALMEAARRGWRLAPWTAEIDLHDEVPCPGHHNGYRLDAATGLGVGWDGTASGCFVDRDGHNVAIICGYWDFEDWNPAPGERGFHEWVHYPESRTLVGVMYLPRIAREAPIP